MKILKNSYITVSRVRGTKVVSMFVTDKEVGIRVKLKDFVDDVIDKIGPITFKVNNKKFKEEVVNIVEELIKEYKKESIKISEKITN